MDLGNGQASDNILIGSPSEGRIEAHIFDGANFVATLGFDNFYTLGETFHLALTIDADGHIRLYKNGLEVADNPNGQAPAELSRTSNLIGQSNWSADPNTDGTIRDLVIMDRSLDAERSAVSIT